MKLHVTSETSRLRAVVLGLPYSPGPTPSLEETFDSKSYESVLHGVYPVEKDIVHEKYEVGTTPVTATESLNVLFGFISFGKTAS